MPAVLSFEAGFPPPTLYAALRPQCAPIGAVKRDYPYVALMQAVLGLAPNTMPVSLLFPSSFSVSAVLIPALVDAPQQPTGLSGDMQHSALAGYAASRRARCSYCTVHCCVLLKRFGVPDAAVAGGGGARTPKQAAAAALGGALAAVPVCDAAGEVREAREHFSERAVELQGAFVTGMGYYNTFNDVMGTDIEEGMLREGRELLGATDWTLGRHKVAAAADETQEVREGFRDGLGLWSKLEILMAAASSIWYEIRATWGVPGGKQDVQKFLAENIGAPLAVFDKISTAKVRKALATVLRDNLTAEECAFPRALKFAMGLAYAVAVGNGPLQLDFEALWNAELKRLASSAPAFVPENLPETLVRVWKESILCGEEWAGTVMDKLRHEEGIRSKDVSALMLALTTFSQPTRTGSKITSALINNLEAAEIVEVVAWVSIVVALSRMTVFYAAAES